MHLMDQLGNFLVDEYFPRHLFPRLQLRGSIGNLNSNPNPKNFVYQESDIGVFFIISCIICRRLKYKIFKIKFEQLIDLNNSYNHDPQLNLDLICISIFIIGYKPSITMEYQKRSPSLQFSFLNRWLIDGINCKNKSHLIYIYIYKERESGKGT